MTTEYLKVTTPSKSSGAFHEAFIAFLISASLCVIELCMPGMKNQNHILREQSNMSSSRIWPRVINDLVKDCSNIT